MVVFFAYKTSTFETPGTAAMASLTMSGQVARVMSSTARGTVRSAAMAAAPKDKAPARTAVIKSCFMGSFPSLALLNAQQPRCDVRERDGRHDQHRSGPKDGLDDAIGQGASARRAVGDRKSTRLNSSH